MAEQAKIPEYLGKCEILHIHDDGDLTIKCGGKKYVVTTEGEAFREVKANSLGVRVSGLARDLANTKCFNDYKRAVEFSEEFDKLLHDADWLELYDGTTFERSFNPKERE